MTVAYHAIHEQPVPTAPLLVETLTWTPCGWCWGQRRIWEQTPEGLVPHPCKRCEGAGTVLA